MNKSRLDEIRENLKAWRFYQKNKQTHSNEDADYLIDNTEFLLAELDRLTLDRDEARAQQAHTASCNIELMRKLDAANDMIRRMNAAFTVQSQNNYSASTKIAELSEALQLAKEKMDKEQPSLSEAYVKIGKLSEALRSVIDSVEHYADMGLIENFCVAEGGCLSDKIDEARKALGESHKNFELERGLDEIDDE